MIDYSLFAEPLVKIAALMNVAKNERDEPKFEISLFQKAEVITSKVRRILLESDVSSTLASVIYHRINGEKPFPIYQNPSYGIAFLPYKGFVPISNINEEMADFGITAIDDDEAVRTISIKRAYAEFIESEIKRYTIKTKPHLIDSELKKNDKVKNELVTLIGQFDKSYRESFFLTCRALLTAYAENNQYDATHNEIATKITQDITNGKFRDGTWKLRVNANNERVKRKLIDISYINSENKTLLSLVLHGDKITNLVNIRIEDGYSSLKPKNINWINDNRLELPSDEYTYIMTDNYHADFSETITKDYYIAKLYSECVASMMRNGHFVTSTSIMDNCYAAPHFIPEIFDLMIGDNGEILDSFEIAFNYINSNAKKGVQEAFLERLFKVTDTMRCDKVELARTIFNNGFDIEALLDNSDPKRDERIRNHEVYSAICSFKLADVLTDSLDDIKYDEHSSNIEISHSLSL